MNVEQLAQELKRMYLAGLGRREATAALTLFGIRYAEESVRALPHASKAATLTVLLEDAGIKSSHEVSISLGIQLARYVVVRPGTYIEPAHQHSEARRLGCESRPG